MMLSSQFSRVLAGRAVLVAGMIVLAVAPWLFGLGTLSILTEFLTMLVLALMWNLVAGKLTAFGGGSGVSLPLSVLRALGARPAERFIVIYWLALALAAAAFLSTWLLLRSRVGLGLTALRDDEEGAGSIGVDLVRAR